MLVQVPPQHISPTLTSQAFPQAPQLFQSVCVLVQIPAQFAWPLGQHVPAVHVWLLVQQLPQAPQFFGSVWRSTQSLPHRVRLFGQVQLPLLHV
jgi:hypothetical protein